MTKLDHNRPILRLIDNHIKLKAIVSEINQNPSSIRQNKSVLKKLPKDAKDHRSRRDLIHAGALIVLAHAEKTGDIRLGCAFVQTIENEKFAKAVVSWLCKYGKFRSSETGLMYDRKATDLTAAEKNPFWLLVDRDRVVNFDLLSRINRVIRDAEKADLDKKSQKFLVQLRRLVDEYVSS